MRMLIIFAVLAVLCVGQYSVLQNTDVIQFSWRLSSSAMGFISYVNFVPSAKSKSLGTVSGLSDPNMKNWVQRSDRILKIVGLKGNLSLVTVAFTNQHKDHYEKWILSGLSRADNTTTYYL